MSFVAPRESALMVYGSALVALLLTLLPLPQIVSVFWPQLLVLTVLYWSTMTPQVGGVLLGFLGGLMFDVLEGTQLGQHALAMSLMAYLAIRLHLITRAKPLFEQSLYVAVALALYEGVLWLVDGWSGHDTSGLFRWLHIPADALLWPVVTGLLGRLHAPR